MTEHTFSTMTNADTTNIIISDANLEGTETIGVAVENLETLEDTDACPDCYLDGLNLDSLQFRNVNLAGANLKGSSCVNTMFEGSDLVSSLLTKCDLSHRPGLLAYRPPVRVAWDNPIPILRYL
ncbi:MAG TPA: pentapeptide repeat-containing protein [Candidatus Handelsmanbacteria bacterium]|nr:pentapeptide repeat-containing protein [Candidatus Handelsmanbacteria bacterium]